MSVGFEIENPRGEESLHYPLAQVCRLISVLMPTFLVILKVGM